MTKTEIFAKEIEYIQNDDIKSFLAIAIENLPDYFFKVAASSTGKYHPKYALGNGGLVRHTKAAARFANHLLGIEQFKNQFTDRERDLIIVAIILHDGWKHGENGGAFTTFEHPVVCAEWVKNTETFKGFINEEELNMVSNAIASHMGEFNTNKRSSITLPKPSDKIGKFVHMCDYLASRKDIEVLFDEEEQAPPIDINTYTLPFGKHKGETLVQIAESDPSYIAWAKENMNKEPIKSLLKQLGD